MWPGFTSRLPLMEDFQPQTKDLVLFIFFYLKFLELYAHTLNPYTQWLNSIEGLCDNGEVTMTYKKSSNPSLTDVRGPTEISSSKIQHPPSITVWLKSMGRFRMDSRNTVLAETIFIVFSLFLIVSLRVQNVLLSTVWNKTWTIDSKYLYYT